MEYHDTYVSFVFSLVEKFSNSTCGRFNSVFQFAVTISGWLFWVECRIKRFWWLSYLHNNFLVFETNLNIFVKETTCTKNHHGFNKRKRSSRSKEVFFQSRNNVSNLRFDTYTWYQNISLKS